MIQFFWKCVVRVVMDIYVKSLEHLGSWIMMVRDQFFLKHKDISLPRFWSHFIAKICVFLFVFLPVFKCLARKIRCPYYVTTLNCINQIQIRMEHIVVFFTLKLCKMICNTSYSMNFSIHLKFVNISDILPQYF